MISLHPYFTPKMLAVFVLGVVSGLPLALVGSTFTTWLRDGGVDLKTIGFMATIGLPYALKFLWAPVLDRTPLPWLTRRLGRRRAWMLVLQMLLMAAIVGMAFSDPARNLGMLAVWAFLAAALSASHDVLIDAYRVELLSTDEQADGAAAGVFGYRVGMLISGAGALFIAQAYGYGMAYLAMAALVPLATLVVLWMGETGAPLAPRSGAGLRGWLREAVVEPLAGLRARERWWLVLLFVTFYKFGDAMAGALTGPFLRDLGFTLGEIGSVNKVFGFAATVLGTYAGAELVRRRGLFGALWVAGILQMLSTAVFAAQAVVGAQVWMLTVTVFAEQFTAGMGTAALVAYLAGQCQRDYTATQYALLSALSAVGRTLFSGASGIIADAFGWVPFFLICAVFAVPGLVLLRLMIANAGGRYAEAVRAPTMRLAVLVGGLLAAVPLLIGAWLLLSYTALLLAFSL